ncbi:hypothetical protein [Agrobacterium sp. NPDC090283]|uniref:hypothetical protein n=1 Tax=Agrobacterium sp. NPDC090283 TaxID=3363920 RepID=UPI00383B72F9
MHRLIIKHISLARAISKRIFCYFAITEDMVVGWHAAFGLEVLDALADNVKEYPERAARTMRVVNSTAWLRATAMRNIWLGR